MCLPIDPPPFICDRAAPGGAPGKTTAQLPVLRAGPNRTKGHELSFDPAFSPFPARGRAPARRFSAAPTRSGAASPFVSDLLRSWPHTHAMEFFPQQPHPAKQPQFDGSVRGRHSLYVFGQLCFRAPPLQVIQRGVRRDAPHPRAPVAFCMKPRMGTIRPPEGFHSQILRCGGIAQDPQHPAINLGLMLAKKSFERIEVACREPLQQFHALPSISFTGLAASRLHSFLYIRQNARAVYHPGGKVQAIAFCWTLSCFEPLTPDL